MIEKMIEAWSSYSWQVKTYLILCIIFLVAILCVAIYDTLEKLMEHKGFRFHRCVLTDEEKEYIKNDVLAVKEALESMFKDD